MIGVFDSGHGGLTVFRSLARRFPRVPFVYFGDHRNVPYGNRPSDEIVALTRDGVDALFRRGCRLVLLGCNTATCVAARTLQKDWLPVSGWTGRNILGIVAPTVEAATQTPLGGDGAPVPAEVQHRCDRRVRHDANDRLARLPRGDPQALSQGHGRAADLRGARGRHRAGRAEDELDRPGGARRDRICWLRPAALRRIVPFSAARTFLWSRPLFRRHLPPFTRLLSQPEVVADSLEDYLQRHPRFSARRPMPPVSPILLTSGEPARIGRVARIFWADAPAFDHVPH
jgi:glutamate racemase